MHPPHRRHAMQRRYVTIINTVADVGDDIDNVVMQMIIMMNVTVDMFVIMMVMILDLFLFCQEWRHAHGMRCLGIPNTAHFANVTFIEDAVACK